VTAIDPSEDQLAYPFGIGDRDLILKLRLRNTDPRSFDGDRRDVISR
jgi:hypothetical protein